MCGIVGIIGTESAGKEAFLGLTTLQHRGQDAAGILTYDETGFHRIRNNGLIESVFNHENMATLTGSLALGHTRYSTAGRGQLSEVQPLVLSYPYGLGLCHNGNIVNPQALSSLLKKKFRRTALTTSDSELLLNLFAEGLAQNQGEKEGETLDFDAICKALELVYTHAIGSFSVVAAIADHGILAFRDPHGIRPLVYGYRKKDGAYMVASESVALEFNGYTPVANLAPGEALFISQDGKVQRKIVLPETARPCMFEWIYFASPESEIDQVPVYGARINLGRSLAKLVATRLASMGIEADIVVPVPETARIAAISLSEELKVPYREVLIKNRYIKRTFILSTQDKRTTAVNLKLSPVRSELKDRVVILVDDSIVRGTTSRKIIELVRNAGAKKVIFVSTCPPIRHSCYYGIDFPNEQELLAFDRTLPDIEKELGADAVIYQDIAGLKLAISEQTGFTPCMACLDGKYPTDISEGKSLTTQRERERKSMGGPEGNRDG